METVLGGNLVLMTNMKVVGRALYGLRLVPKSVTLNDPQRCNGHLSSPLGA